MMSNSARALLLLTLIVNLIVSLYRFPLHSFPDSQQYILMVDLFAGNVTDISVRAPFVYRVLVPILAAPLSGIFGSGVSLCIVNLLFSAIYCVCMVLLIESYCSSMLVSCGTYIAFLFSTTISFFGGVALADTPAIALVALLLLLSRSSNVYRDYFSYTIVILGCLTKEIMLFGALAYFMLTKDKRVLVISLISTMLIRFVSGSFTQPLSWANINWQTAYLQTLGVVLAPLVLVPLIISAWVQHYPLRESLIFGIITISALAPYSLMGLFLASYDSRFLWPILIGLAPICGIGIKSAWVPFKKRLKEVFLIG